MAESGQSDRIQSGVQPLVVGGASGSDRIPRTAAARSLSVDGRWNGDRESLVRQLDQVEREAASIPPGVHDCVAIEAELERAVAERDAIAAEIHALDAEAAAPPEPPLITDEQAEAWLKANDLIAVIDRRDAEPPLDVELHAELRRLREHGGYDDTTIAAIGSFLDDRGVAPDRLPSALDVATLQAVWREHDADPAWHGRHDGGCDEVCMADLVYRMRAAVPDRLPSVEALARMFDGDDGGDPGHDRQTDDPGDGSGPAFCVCGRWRDTDHITYGQHIADEWASLHEEPTEQET